MLVKERIEMLEIWIYIPVENEKCCYYCFIIKCAKNFMKTAFSQNFVSKLILSYVQLVFFLLNLFRQNEVLFRRGSFCGRSKLDKKKIIQVSLISDENKIEFCLKNVILFVETTYKFNP